jgi:hypothetical protein
MTDSSWNDSDDYDIVGRIIEETEEQINEELSFDEELSSLLKETRRVEDMEEGIIPLVPPIRNSILTRDPRPIDITQKMNLTPNSIGLRGNWGMEPEEYTTSSCPTPINACTYVRMCSESMLSCLKTFYQTVLEEIRKAEENISLNNYMD